MQWYGIFVFVNYFCNSWKKEKLLQINWLQRFKGRTNEILSYWISNDSKVLIYYTIILAIKLRRASKRIRVDFRSYLEFLFI